MNGGIILSGGPDSAVAAYDVVKGKPEIDWTAFHFTYGQLAIPEWHCASNLAMELEIPIRRIEIPPSLLTSTMTANAQHRAADNIEPTFVPGRNILFITMVAASIYEKGKPIEIVGGWNAADSAGYPDCRVSFIGNMQIALQLGLDCDIFITSPVIHMQKEEIIWKGEELGVPWIHTWSCYTPIFIEPAHYVPCRKCVSCELRAKGFDLAGVRDPLFGR